MVRCSGMDRMFGDASSKDSFKFFKGLNLTFEFVTSDLVVIGLDAVTTATVDALIKLSDSCL